MTNAILITGNTYPHRRNLRSAGALFDYDEKGYIASSDNEQVKQIALDQGLNATEYNATEEQLTPATGERLRKIRQDRIDRRRQQLYKQADATDRRAEEARNRISKSEADFLALAEPIKIGHHSEGRHRKLIERSRKAASDACAEWEKAEKLRRKADNMLDASVKGDAERARQKRIAKADESINVGDLVHCVFMSGDQGIVEKKNKRTFTLRSLDTGDLIPIEKEFCTLIEKRKPVKRERRFKKGDEVLYTHGASKYRAVVTRRTPNGYKIKYERTFWGKTSEEGITVRESSLTEYT